MKIVVFGPERRVGALQGDRVVDLNYAFVKYTCETQDEPRPYELGAFMVPPNLEAFIASGSRALEGAQRALEYLSSQAQNDRGPRGEPIVHTLKEVKLHPPLASRASRIMCAGGNFADHVQGIRWVRHRERVSREQVTEEIRRQGIWGFWKIAHHTVGPEDEVIYPARTRLLDCEGEVAVVLGKKGKDIPPQQAQEYIWGYTLHNDWSARDQRDPQPFNFALGKNFDTSSSLGPCIVVGEITDPQNVDFETRVNGELRQRGNTRDMVFTFAECIAFLSRDMTLLPGDILSGGTCAGTALDSSERDPQGNWDLKLFLKPGDVVEVSSPQIGTLRNRVVAKPS